MLADSAGPGQWRGGGWGDPKKRPAEKVAEEVRDGMISLEQVREAYGVILDEKTLELDKEKTKRLRWA